MQAFISMITGTSAMVIESTASLRTLIALGPERFGAAPMPSIGLNPSGGIVLGVAQNVGAQIAPNGFLIAGHAVFLLVLGARLVRQRMKGSS